MFNNWTLKLPEQPKRLRQQKKEKRMEKRNLNWLFFLNNKGETINPANPGSPVEPNLELETPPQEPNVPPAPPQEPNVFDSFIQKKGFKSNDDIVKSYENVEAEFHRTKNVFNTVKHQLDSAGYTIDDKGNVVQKNDPYAQPAPNPYQYNTVNQPYQQPYQQQEPIYDPYTGQPITDPLGMQLAQMPVGQREVFMFNALAQQREQLQGDAFKAEQEILSKPEAKGFENDVKQVMMQVPIQQRANKEAWERALYEVKGRRYDQDRQNWGKQGVDDFINKEGVQGLPAVPGGGVSVKLTPEQEQTYKWYQETMPGKFKDKAHFLKAASNTYGR